MKKPTARAGAVHSHYTAQAEPKPISPELVEQAARFMIEGHGHVVPRKYWSAIGWWALRGLAAARRAAA